MKKKIIAIHQPDFMPYIGFFHRLLHCDLFVILDNVQFVRNTKESWHNRDKIKTPAGQKWLTVSVKKTPIHTKINEVFLSANADWRKKNLNQILENYKESPFFFEIFPYIEEIYKFECEKMVEFNIKSIKTLMNLFGLTNKIVFASVLGSKGKKNELLVEILEKVNATHYLSGTGAKAYLDLETFKKGNIEVVWQDFKHPVYSQLYGEFIPNLSSLDLFFNCGIEKSSDILRLC